MDDTQAKTEKDAAAISTADLKSRRATVTLDRLQAARQEGHIALTVTNKNRPILHLGYEDDLPNRWRSDEIQHVPFSDMRTGKVSLLGLRRDRQALLLTQQGAKPTLALWPLEVDDSKLGNGSRSPAINIETRNASLHRRLAKVEKRVEKLEMNLEVIGLTFARLLTSARLTKPE